MESTAKRITFMMHVREQNNLKEEYVTKIYDEWIGIARRLKTGKEMIERTIREVINQEELKQHKQYINLCHLYEFLINVLGIYDKFFELSLSESHHKQLQATVLDEMRD